MQTENTILTIDGRTYVVRPDTQLDAYDAWLADLSAGTAVTARAYRALGRVNVRIEGPGVAADGTLSLHGLRVLAPTARGVEVHNVARHARLADQRAAFTTLVTALTDERRAAA